MSRGVNKAIILGHVGQDPEMKYTQGGTAIANLSVATSETWKDKNTGEQQTRAEWHRISAFGKLAEIIGQYVKKGSKVYIEGKIQTRKWKGQDGVDRYSTEIVANELQMLDSRSDNSGGQRQPQRPQGGGTQGTTPGDDLGDGSDIPF